MSTILNHYRGNMPAHSSGGGGGGFGGGGTTYNIFTLTNCSTGASVSATDPSSFAPSVGDVVAVTPSGGSAVCATVASSGTSSTDPATTITATFSSCGDCNATNFCHAPSDFSMTLSGGSYTSYSYRDVVQVAASGSLSAVNIETKLTLESSLGSRAASDVVLSNYGQVTGLSISSGFIDFNFDGTGCFTNASETMMYRLKVECGDNSTGSWVTHSTSYSSWSSVMINHAGASQQCSSGGSNFQVTDCNSGATAIIDDSGGYGIQVGDFVDWYDNSGNGPFCAEVTASSSGTATGSAYGGSYTDCADCNSSNGLSQHELTDCNTGATHIVTDAASMVYSVGDVISYYDLSYTNVYCGTVTTMNVTGTAGYETSSGYTDCAECNSYEGL